MNIFDDNKKNNNIDEIEIIMGDDSSLNFSDVESFIPDFKPTSEKKKNIVIPNLKSKKNSKEKK